MALDIQPLQDIRILDFSRVLAGPFATRILADFGAEVIKVQSQRTATGSELNTGSYFRAWNRNKRSITIDLRFPEGRELVLRLVALCDVVVENFSPRVMANWDLTYEHLIQVKPDLIMLSMSGMGQTGPLSNQYAFGPTVQALGGLTHLTAYEEGEPSGPGYAHADPLAGLYGAFAVLAALNHRDQTGRGEYIDLSEYEAVSSLIGVTLMDSIINQEDTFLSPNQAGHKESGPHGCYQCLGTDRWCVIAVSNENQWQSLCEILGLHGSEIDEMFSDPIERSKHSKELDKLINDRTSRLEPEIVVERLQQAGVPAGIVQNAEDLKADSHLLARSFFVDMEDPVCGNIQADGSVIRFREEPTGSWKPSPLLGEANRYVFLDLLGLTEKEFGEYVQCGVIG